jgi:putative mRNA 3-end processing factor
MYADILFQIFAMSPLLTFTDKGIYCRAGDFYIDPWSGVDYAVITHAHSDHARYGSRHYLSHRDSAPILRLRLGPDISLQTVDYHQSLDINGVKVTLYPAGHIIGSAQVRVEYKGEVWVASGDYKTEDDGISTAFEPVRCHSFITESTFGLPVYRWKKQSAIFDNINQWWRKNQEAGKTSILFGYSLGKAQRILEHLDKSVGNIYAHTAVYNAQKAFLDFGLPLYPVKQWTYDVPKDTGAMIVAPPSAAHSPWLKRFEPYATGVCSGWMQVRGRQRRGNADAGFALSDHADWPGLLDAIKSTGAEKVYVTHGYQSVFSRYLNEIGIESEEVVTQYGDDESDGEDRKDVDENPEVNNVGDMSKEIGS